MLEVKLIGYWSDKIVLSFLENQVTF